MSIQHLINYELKNIRRGLIRNQLWKLSEIVKHFTEEFESPSEKEAAYKLLYDVIVSTEWLEKEIDSRKNF